VALFLKYEIIYRIKDKCSKELKHKYAGPYTEIPYILTKIEERRCDYISTLPTQMIAKDSFPI